ncbi:MAG: hypothetical protein H7235_08095 [Bdellovibrionaceae bacterium]|nr:hypothetical protein [Pseudobdellovibrionaceae bacterium]
MDLSLFVSSIKAQFKIKFLALHVSARFSSAQNDARPQIRHDIVQNYSPLLSSSEKRAILVLDSLPVVENLFFSISHNKSVGGYAACDQRVGFDMEEVTRLNLETVNRVCTPAEIAACPDFKLLWSAKEPTLKTLKQLLVMSDIQILNWKQENGLFYFEASIVKISAKNKRAVIVHENNTIACSFQN